MKPDTDKLCRQINYRFIYPDLLQLALTHRSASSQHNERAEYLGDSILNFVIAHALYEKYPDATEGELSRYRATLVKKDTLAEIARNLDLGDYIKLGSGELKSGGFRRASILADALEALIAAVLLDSGFESAKKLIHFLFDRRIKTVIEKELKDPKSRLQEFLQSRRFDLPKYEVKSISGDPHLQHFVIVCDVAALSLQTEGEGSSRRRAEQAAAEAALAEIQKNKIK
ncbi:MAG TPA: ribonuclease III [Gammaproteobacteria bacterium]|nr:ribonuclease III [Gammaproteobacteria bacterium]